MYTKLINDRNVIALLRESNILLSLKMILDGHGGALVCEFTKPSCTEMPTVRVKFQNITKFRADEVNGFNYCISGLDYVWVGTDQMENIDWHVIDYEDNAIEILCKNVEVELL